jgi:hypothetical protein
MSSVMTPKFRVSFPSILKPKKNELNGKEEYSLVALFPKKADLSQLKIAAHAACEKKWGSDTSKWPKLTRSPFRDQAEKAKNVDGRQVLPPGYEEGAIFLTLKSQQRPGLVDQHLNDIISESDFYAGCWARATLTAYAYDQLGNKGVSFGLSNVQKVADGDPLSGRPKPQEDFVPIGESNSPSNLFD